MPVNAVVPETLLQGPEQEGAHGDEEIAQDHRPESRKRLQQDIYSFVGDQSTDEQHSLTRLEIPESGDAARDLRIRFPMDQSRAS